MVTMKDVAKLAGVSHGTVSNIINGGHNVSLDKIRRVEQAMKMLGYRPNKFAQSLKTNRTMHVDVILPNSIDFSLGQIFSSIAMSAHQRGYHASLYITGEDAEQEREYLNNAVMSQSDGVILMTCQPRKKGFFQELLKTDTKIVLIQRQVEGLDCNFVGFNAERLIGHFARRAKARGISRLILFTNSGEFTFEKNCIAQFHETVARVFGGQGCGLVAETNYNKESALKAAVGVLHGTRERTAVLATNQLLYIGVNKALELLGLPGDMVEAQSFDAMTWARREAGDVEKMGLPCITLGEEAFRLLYEELQSPMFSEPKRVCIDVPAPEPPPAAAPAVTAGREPLRLLMLESSAADATRTLLGEFEKSAGIPVRMEAVPYSGLYDAILSGYAESGFDLCEVDLPWIPHLASTGILEDIGAFDGSYRRYMGDVIDQIIPDFTQYRGRTYAFPYMFCSQLLFYRKDLFEDITNKGMFYDQYKTELRPPKTWSEFNAVARFFTKACNPESQTLYGTTLGGCTNNGSVCEFLPRLWSYGGDIIKNGRIAIDSEEAVRALANYRESFQYASPGSPDHWWGEQCAEFCAGKAAMMILFNAHAADLTDRMKSKVVGRVGFDAIPGSVSLMGGWSMGISTKSAQKAQALEFLKWICSEKFSIINTVLGGCSPCKKVYEDAEIAGVYPWHRKMVDVFPQARKRDLPHRAGGENVPFHPFEIRLGDLVHRTVRGDLEPREALAQAASYLKEFYQIE